MASSDQKMKKNSFVKKDRNWKKSKNEMKGVQTKRKWIQENKPFEGSVKEGVIFNILIIYQLSAVLMI